jgi:predicted DNA-binding protein
MRGTFSFSFFLPLVCCAKADLRLDSHYLLEAIEERGMQEVVDRNLAIEALKKEVDTLKAEKTRLAREVGGLCTTQGDL